MTSCQKSSWPFALLEISHCDHVHAVCLRAEVMVTGVCVLTGFACASEKVSDVGTETGTDDVVVTDSYVAVWMHDVVVMQTYHQLHHVSLRAHRELVEISTCPNVVAIFGFCLEMLIVQHEL